MSKKELVAQDSKAIIAATAATLEEYGLDFSDISIPRISIQQGLSKLVEDGKARPSEIANHTTEEVLGGTEKPFKFVVVGFFKSVLTNDSNGKYMSRKNVRSFIGVNYDGENGSNNYIENNFYVVPYDKLKAGFCIPCIMTFRGKQHRPSMHIMSTALELAPRGIQARDMVVEMISVAEKNDKGKFYVPKFAIKDTTSKEEKGLPEMWYNTLKSVDLSSKAQSEDAPAKKEETQEAYNTGSF